MSINSTRIQSKIFVNQNQMQSKIFLNQNQMQSKIFLNQNQMQSKKWKSCEIMKTSIHQFSSFRSFVAFWFFAFVWKIFDWLKNFWTVLFDDLLFEKFFFCDIESKKQNLFLKTLSLRILRFFYRYDNVVWFSWNFLCSRLKILNE